MCGLIGIIPYNNKYIDTRYTTIFEQLLWVGALRGFDGTGMFKLTHGDKVDILKVADSPPEFFSALDAYKVSLFGQLLVGHNRAATKGKAVYEHTHPFQEGHITLVHNGTLFNHKQHGNREVDSHVICDLLSAGKTPQDLIKSLVGAYALIWYDELEESLFALRNNDRPLHILKTDNYYILVSEPDMAKWILGRNGVKVISTKPLEPYTLLELKPGQKNYKLTKLKEPKFWERWTGNVHNKTLPAVLVQPAQTTQKIVEQNGLKVGDVVEVETLYCNRTQNKWGDCWASLKSNRKLTVKYWSEEDYTCEDVKVKIKAFVNVESNQYILAENPVPVKEKPDESEFVINDCNFDDEEGILETANGVLMTSQVINQVKDQQCSMCSAKFIYSTNITLMPQKKNQHIYRYTYYCPDCTKKLNKFVYADAYRSQEMHQHD